MSTQLPDISLKNTEGEPVNLLSYQGKPLILFFYPKASTPGCTQEGLDFKEHYEDFQTLGVEILGVSRDGVKAQKNFKEKQGFPFELLSDKEEELCRYFDVIKEKKMFGKVGFGIQRTTLLFDKKGKLIKEYQKVKVKGHVDDVLEDAQAFFKTGKRVKK